jgi:RNA polymerase sigma factor (sigma-70 family)
LCYSGVCMQLAERLAEDVDGAFLDLVTTYQDLVFAVALRVVSQRSDAEDVAQEAFVRAYRALRRYPGERIRALQLRPWLARVTLNLARNHVRDRRPATDLEAVGNRAATPAEEPASLVERREARDAWARLLAALPERYRLAVTLRHVDGLSYRELAEALRRPVGSVKSDVHRGVQLLRAAYDAEQRGQRQREAV